MKTVPELFKKDDKIKCIKNFYGLTNSKELYYEKNLFYYISNIVNSTYEIQSLYNLPLYFDTRETSLYNINEYFINIKEERKQKLNKLQSC